MQRWEYRVVSLKDGEYTQSLNAYGRDGWELVAVTTPPPPPREAPEESGGSRRLPLPRAFGKLEEAAGAIQKLEGRASSSALLWVLRRPLADDEDDEDEADEPDA